MHTPAGDRLIELFRAKYENDAVVEETLRIAGRHLDRAAMYDEAVDEHGPLIDGSRGTKVINPAAPEARHSRVAAFAIIKEVFPDEEAAGEALDAASVEQQPKNEAKQRAALARWERARARQKQFSEGAD